MALQNFRCLFEDAYGKLEQKNSELFSLKSLKSRLERLKSALYVRLKKRKTFLIEKNLKFFSFGKCRIVPKNAKGGTLWNLLTYIILQNIKKLEGGHF